MPKSRNIFYSDVDEPVPGKITATELAGIIQERKLNGTVDVSSYSAKLHIEAATLDAILQLVDYAEPSKPTIPEKPQT